MRQEKRESRYKGMHSKLSRLSSNQQTSWLLGHTGHPQRGIWKHWVPEQSLGEEYRRRIYLLAPSVSCHLLARVSPSLHRWVSVPHISGKFCHQSSGIKLVKGHEAASFYACLSAACSPEDPPEKPVGGLERSVRPWHLQGSSDTESTGQERRALQCEVRGVRGGTVWSCLQQHARSGAAACCSRTTCWAAQVNDQSATNMKAGRQLSEPLPVKMDITSLFPQKCHWCQVIFLEGHQQHQAEKHAQANLRSA